ncbi:TPM domain-containing protein [Herbiconiux sp. A18JL235]|uniref:TPM domain-containing protein n=1 Tax=Herbiconiux sp. A18JL235 TaxID=3152363 RepID=A0AB39BL55_9MICO
MRAQHRTRRVASIRSVLAAVAGLAAGLLVPVLLIAAPASATDPVDLAGRYVVDDAGVLDAAALQQVQDAVDELATEQGVNLFVVYTDSFTNPSDRQAWTDEVASINQFGRNDVLLAVAVDDRVYQLSVDSSFALDDDQLTSIETDDIVPQLHDSDWAGAGVAAADGISRELGGDGVAGGSGHAQEGLGIGGFIWVIAGIIIVVGLAVLVIVLVRRRKTLDRRDTAAAELAGPTQKELDQRVGAVLIDLDDAVTSSEEELGFAVAQFGQEATAQFTTVLGEVKGSLSQAFALKQKLDDAVPDTDEERRAWSQQIIEICDAAADRLDDQLEAFTALRDLERDPAPALAAARQTLATVGASEDDARARLATLGTNYDPGALGTVAGNVDQADKLRDFAEAELDTAARLVGAADASTAAGPSASPAAHANPAPTPAAQAGAAAPVGSPDSAAARGGSAEAALRIRNAQQALAQAVTLLESLATLERDLGAAQSGLGAAVDDAALDIAEAEKLAAAQPGANAEIERMAAALRIELDRARSLGARDPLNARIALEKANAPLDTALAALRDERERAARLQAQRDRAIASAQSEVAAAQSFLQTRRGAVGSDARTRLSEAERHLQQAIALSATDPARSLDEATQASRMASLATASAQQDVTWARDTNWGAGTSSSSRDDSFGGAVLGGILGGLFDDDRGGGSSWSSGWSGGWGGGSRGSSWSSSRRSSGGSFGGGRSSSRASRSSSRSSGGGRRGGGGRF